MKAEVVQISKGSKRKQEEDLYLLNRFKLGDVSALTELIETYHGFIKLKASNYFMVGGDTQDLIQEGLIGFFKAVRDYRPRKASFRTFAELCITRQIITAIKTASRAKHSPLNNYLSLNHSPSSTDEEKCTLGDILPSSHIEQPDVQVAANEEREALIQMLKKLLSGLESDVLLLYLSGMSYEQIAEELSVDTKSVDNALQRIKRKVELHLESRRIKGIPTPASPTEPQGKPTSRFREFVSPRAKVLRAVSLLKTGGAPRAFLAKRTDLEWWMLDDILDTLIDEGKVVMIAGQSRAEDIYVAKEYFEEE